jgi:hypothetical protein
MASRQMDRIPTPPTQLKTKTVGSKPTSLCGGHPCPPHPRSPSAQKGGIGGNLKKGTKMEGVW